MQAKILLDLFLLVYGLIMVFAVISCAVYIITGKLIIFSGVTSRVEITPKRKKFIRILGTVLCIFGVVACVSEATACVKDIPYAITNSAMEVKGVATYVLNGTWNIGPNSVTIRDELTGESVNLFTMQVIHTGYYSEAIYYPNTKLSIITGYTSKTN